MIKKKKKPLCEHTWGFPFFCVHSFSNVQFMPEIQFQSHRTKIKFHLVLIHEEGWWEGTMSAFCHHEQQALWRICEPVATVYTKVATFLHWEESPMFQMAVHFTRSSQSVLQSSSLPLPAQEYGPHCHAIVPGLPFLRPSYSGRTTIFLLLQA